MNLPNLLVEFRVQVLRNDQIQMYLLIAEGQNQEQKHLMKIQNHLQTDTIYSFTPTLKGNVGYRYKFEICSQNKGIQENNFRSFQYQLNQQNKIDEWNKIWIGYRFEADKKFFDDNLVYIIKQDKQQIELSKSNCPKYVEEFDQLYNEKILNLKIAFKILNKNTNIVKQSEFHEIGSIAERMIQAGNYPVFQFKLSELNKKINFQQNQEVRHQDLQKENVLNNNDHVKNLENEINFYKSQIQKLEQQLLESNEQRNNYKIV